MRRVEARGARAIPPGTFTAGATIASIEEGKGRPVLPASLAGDHAARAVAARLERGDGIAAWRHCRIERKSNAVRIQRNQILLACGFRGEICRCAPCRPVGASTTMRCKELGARATCDIIIPHIALVQMRKLELAEG